MRHLIDRPDLTGLVANIALAVAAALLVNGLIFLFAPASEPRIQPAFAPAGWVIGLVWTILFALMGTARWLTVLSDQPQSQGHAALIVLLIAFCAAYPAYTVGLSNLQIGLVGNIATILATVWIAGRVRSTSAAAAALLLPIVLWVAFATVLVVRVLQLN